MSEKRMSVKVKLPWKPWSELTPEEKRYGRPDPFCIAFVYPRKGHAFAVTGGTQTVIGWIPRNTVRSLSYFIIYRARGLRNYMTLVTTDKDKEYTFSIKRRRIANPKAKKNQKWVMTVFKKAENESIFGKVVFEKYLKRPPRHWPKEFDQFIISDPIQDCLTCEHAIHGNGGKMGINGCRLSAYAKLGIFCPLKNNENSENSTIVNVEESVTEVEEVTFPVQPEFEAEPETENFDDLQQDGIDYALELSLLHDEEMSEDDLVEMLLQSR